MLFAASVLELTCQVLRGIVDKVIERHRFTMLHSVTRLELVLCSTTDYQTCNANVYRCASSRILIRVNCESVRRSIKRADVPADAVRVTRKIIVSPKATRWRHLRHLPLHSSRHGLVTDGLWASQSRELSSFVGLLTGRQS